MIKTIVSRLLFSAVILAASLPARILAGGSEIYYPPGFNWAKIILGSLVVFLVSFLAWIVSPLGIIFIAASLVQFLVSQKTVRIIAWVFQGLTFLFTLLLAIIAAIYSFSLYGEQKYMLLFGIIPSLIVIFLLMIGSLVAQLIWQRNKTKSEENKY